MGIQILNKDVSVISGVMGKAKANIGSIFAKGGWGTVSGPATQGPNSPSNVSVFDYDDEFQNPTNIFSSNNQYVTIQNSVPGSQYGYLHTYGYGFSIPTSATINGIEVTIEAKSDAGDVITIGLWGGGAYNAGAGIGTPISTATLTTSDVVYTLGGPTNLWGATITAANINDTYFGPIINEGNTFGLLSIDHMTVKVYYTT